MLQSIQLDWKIVLIVLGVLAVIGLLLSILLLAWIMIRIKRIQLPPGADFLTTLRATPLSVVILLDVLDLALDIFSAPISWILLGYLGLESLRTVTVVESVIPGTQFLPTMTAAWLVARLTDPRRTLQAR